MKIPVRLAVAGPVPALSPAAVTNAASFASNALAPGALFTIFAPGNLSAETVAALDAPWPLQLTGVSVTIGGFAAPLGYVSPTQINGQIPFEVAPGQAQLVVQVYGSATQAVTVNIGAAAPGVFLLAGNRAAAVNQDGTINAAQAPAPAGSVISVYFTGQGPLDDVAFTGAAASYEYLCNTVLSTQATIGGQPATVQFSGLAPRYIGLAQANLTVPSLPPGDYPVIVSVGDVQSNAGTISVSAAGP
jgi:uncharacterized protein (TIGR03437 family)